MAKEKFSFNWEKIEESDDNWVLPKNSFDKYLATVEGAPSKADVKAVTSTIAKYQSAMLKSIDAKGVYVAPNAFGNKEDVAIKATAERVTVSLDAEWLHPKRAVDAAFKRLCGTEEK